MSNNNNYIHEILNEKVPATFTDVEIDGHDYKCIIADELYFLYECIYRKLEYTQYSIKLEKDMNVVDIGGNIGVFARYAAEKGANVYSFEPVKKTFDCLQENAKLHEKQNPNCGSIEVYHKGVASYEGIVKLGHYEFCTLWSGWNPNQSETRMNDILELMKLNIKPELHQYIKDVAEKWNGTITMEDCKVDTVENILNELQLDTVDLLKVDAEEAEKDILDGIPKHVWPRINQVVAECHDEILDDDGEVLESGRVEAIVKLLKANGFTHVVAEKGPPPNFMIRRLNGHIRKSSDDDREFPVIKYNHSVMYNVYASK